MQNSCELYGKFWLKLVGYDLKDTQNGRILSKGKFYRIHTSIAESLANGEPLPKRFELVERSPFVPFVERNGKIYQKQILENNKK